MNKKHFIIIVTVVGIIVLLLCGCSNQPIKYTTETPIIDKLLPEYAETTTEAKKTTPKFIEMNVVVTAYCPCKECSEGYGIQTSTGAIATAGRTVAVDPTVIPYGSKVIINGHCYIAEDCGGAIKGNRIDLFFDTHEEVIEWGKKNLSILVSKSS